MRSGITWLGKSPGHTATGAEDELRGAGVSKLVVQPQDWDERGDRDSAWLPIGSTNSDPEPLPRERRA